MNIEQLYRDHGITYVTSGHKHSREGWVNTACPFCQGHSGYHLGYDTTGDKFVCWRCGGHGISKVLQALLHKNYREIKEIIHIYGQVWQKTAVIKRKIVKKQLRLPATEEELTSKTIKYLKSRNFNPTKLKNIWGVKSTSVFSKIDGINYAHRILIPYYWDGEIVSFDTRDVTGKASVRFMACKEERETIKHKNILYGLQEHWGEIGYCVEGCADVWRMGVESFAVSGIKFTPPQVRCIAKYFKKVAVIFDNEPQARIQANKLVAELKFRGVDARRIDLPKGMDPGDMSNKEIKNLKQNIKEIFGEFR